MATSAAITSSTGMPHDAKIGCDLSTKMRMLPIPLSRMTGVVFFVRKSCIGLVTAKTSRSIGSLLVSSGNTMVSDLSDRSSSLLEFFSSTSGASGFILFFPYPHTMHVSSLALFRVPHTSQFHGSRIFGFWSAPQCGHVKAESAIFCPHSSLTHVFPSSTYPQIPQTSSFSEIWLSHSGQVMTVGMGGWSAVSTSRHHSSSS